MKNITFKIAVYIGCLIICSIFGFFIFTYLGVIFNVMVGILTDDFYLYKDIIKYLAIIGAGSGAILSIKLSRSFSK